MFPFPHKARCQHNQNPRSSFHRLTSGFGSLMATEHYLEIWAWFRVLKNSNRFTNTKGKERFFERTTLICCFSESLCKPWITELQGSPHEHHHSVGLASCILLSIWITYILHLKKPQNQLASKKPDYSNLFWCLLLIPFRENRLFYLRLGSKARSKGICPFPHAIVYWTSHIHNHLKEGCAIYDIVVHEENLP